MAFTPMPSDYPECGTDCVTCSNPVEAEQGFFLAAGVDTRNDPRPWPVEHWTCALERAEARPS